MSASVYIASTKFKPFADEQLQELEERFGVIDVYTPPPRPRGRWAPALPPDAPPPDPPFSLVFRAATRAEWANSQKQVNDPKTISGAPTNLAMACIVAVSLDGEHFIHTGAPGTPPNDRANSKPPRDAFERLLSRPGFAGVPEDVADLLAKLNALNAGNSEKG